jgi:hypothetical protein
MNKEEIDKIKKNFYHLVNYDTEMGDLYESTLNRVTKWIQEKEIAGISGWRDEITDIVPNSGNEWDQAKGKLEKEQRKLTRQEKNARNGKLKASLLSLDYGVTEIKGNFWEHYNTPNQVEVIEDSFLVVNLHDDPNFYNNIFKLGVYYNQDSILWSPKNSLDGYQVGTNNATWLGYGKKRKTGTYRANVESEYMSRIGNAPFTFADSEDTSPNSNPSFDDRKRIRKKKAPQRKIDEIILGTFDKFNNHNNYLKYLIKEECRDVLKILDIKSK